MSAIESVITIMDIITITKDSGNKNESVSPNPKASDMMPCFL
ncbi:MAG: hypothetical protein Q4D57_05785 [Clostridia bacterium]|nr:hypothetical protein [Clostridia bacterium]